MSIGIASRSTPLDHRDQARGSYNGDSQPLATISAMLPARQGRSQPECLRCGERPPIPNRHASKEAAHHQPHT